MAAAWPVLWRAVRTGTLATTGPYARLRHPQYLGFILIMTGFLLQWPTLVTLVMYPVLVVMYVVLAVREDRRPQPASVMRIRGGAPRCRGGFPACAGHRSSTSPGHSGTRAGRTGPA